MTFTSVILAWFRAISIRRARSKIGGVAIVACCIIALFSATAGSQNVFVYRDLNTGIKSDIDQSVSLRFMRHIWIVDYNDPVLAAVVQQGGYEGHGLALYKSLNAGGNWSLESDLSSEVDLVSDGVLDAQNNLLLVTSLIGESRTADVTFIKLIYQPTLKQWTLDPLTPVTVFSSSDLRRATRATLSVDSNGVIWCAFRFKFDYSGVPGYVQIRVFYSADGGYTWTDSGNRFGTPNRLAQKSGKVIAVGSRTALVYQDLQGVPPNTSRYAAWAYREDSQPLEDAWTSGVVSQLVSSEDTLGTHWSVAADDSGNVHWSYQDAGIRYLKYDGASGEWLDPQVIATYDGSYNCISVAANHELYLFSRFSGAAKVFCKRYSPGTQSWSRWLAMSSSPHDGYLRMSSPERFLDRLPLIYEANANIPYDILYVLFDTAALTVCRQAP